MHHTGGDTCEAPQAVWRVQIPQHRHDTLGTQFDETGRAGSQRDNTHIGAHQTGDTDTHIATTDDQDTFTPESGWQGAEGALD